MDLETWVQDLFKVAIEISCSAQLRRYGMRQFLIYGEEIAMIGGDG